MVSINTNISSLIVQNSLNKATNGLNTALERLSTGFRINHAKDDAAGYAIGAQMSSKLSSYTVAEQNTYMGLDMLSTAMGSLEVISEHLLRTRALAEQAANGTYDEASRRGIQGEIDSLLNESERIYDSTEYNGINIFKQQGTAGGSGTTTVTPPEAKYNGFIKEVEQLSESEAIAQGYTVIKTADELQEMQNDLDGKYILMNDIDLSGYSWTPVGADESTPFTGEFNGNGYTIENLEFISTVRYNGLFGSAYNAKFSNVSLKDIKIDSIRYWTAALVGYIEGGEIDNCKVTDCYIRARGSVGGLVGEGDNVIIKNSYTSGTVVGESRGASISGHGGLVGVFARGKIENCYSEANVEGHNEAFGVGGLVGDFVLGSIENSYSTGDVSCEFNYVGGLVGWGRSGNINNCFTESKILDGSSYSTGAFVGYIETADFVVKNSVYYSRINPSLSVAGNNDAGADLSGITDGDAAPPTQPNPPAGGTTALPEIVCQIGINGDENSRISLAIGFDFTIIPVDVMTSASASAALTEIDEMLAKINKKQTEYGAVYNRLESAAKSINVSIETLTMSLSTIKDADIAEESSEYLRQQILQSASATLLSTANQTSNVALALINGLGR